MGGADVFYIVSVKVFVHCDAVFPERLMVLRAGQRRQTKKFKEVNRQLLLDDGYIALDRLRCVRRKAQDLTSDGQNPLLFPSQQHLAILGDLVLPLLSRR